MTTASLITMQTALVQSSHQPSFKCHCVHQPTVLQCSELKELLQSRVVPKLALTLSSIQPSGEQSVREIELELTDVVCVYFGSFMHLLKDRRLRSSIYTKEECCLG